MRKERVKKVEVNLYFASTNATKERLDEESKRFLLTKSQIVNMFVQHCLEENVLEELMMKRINKKG